MGGAGRVTPVISSPARSACLSPLIAHPRALAARDGLARDRGDLVATIRAEADRLDRVVGNLLDLSRLRSGVAAPHAELWTADDLVYGALEQCRDKTGNDPVVTLKRGSIS